MSQKRINDPILDRIIGVVLGAMGVIFGSFLFYVALSIALLTGASDLIGKYSSFLGEYTALGFFGIVFFLLTAGPFLALAYFGAAHNLSVSVITRSGPISLANAPLLDGILQLAFPVVLLYTGVAAAQATSGRRITIPVYAGLSVTVGYVIFSFIWMVVGTIVFNIFSGLIIATYGGIGAAIIGFDYPPVTTIPSAVARTTAPYLVVGAVLGTVIEAFKDRDSS